MHIEAALVRYYGIHPDSLAEAPPGWSALAYRVQAGQALYFLKVFDKTRPSIQVWIQAIDRYMPVLLWLGESTALRGRVPSVVRTKDGHYQCEDERHIYILFDFIPGESPCATPITPPKLAGQRRELTRLIADLHCLKAGDFPGCKDGLTEDFSVPFHDRLLSMLPCEEIRAHRHLLERQLYRLAELSAAMPALRLPFVLCHNDIHGGNMIQSKRLVLVDWEGLKFAPAEADMLFFTYWAQFHTHWEEFLAVYRETHPGWRPNETAMQFYRLRRSLEDIEAFLDALLHDNLSPARRESELRHLTRELELLQKEAHT